MKLSEAHEAVGRGVVYSPAHGAREDGTIVRCSGDYVFVDYHGQIKATHPGDLELLAYDTWAPC